MNSFTLSIIVFIQGAEAMDLDRAGTGSMEKQNYCWYKAKFNGHRYKPDKSRPCVPGPTACPWKAYDSLCAPMPSELYCWTYSGNKAPMVGKLTERGDACDHHDWGKDCVHSSGKPGKCYAFSDPEEDLHAGVVGKAVAVDWQQVINNKIRDATEGDIGEVEAELNTFFSAGPVPAELQQALEAKKEELEAKKKELKPLGGVVSAEGAERSDRPECKGAGQVVKLVFSGYVAVAWLILAAGLIVAGLPELIQINAVRDGADEFFGSRNVETVESYALPIGLSIIVVLAVANWSLPYFFKCK